MGRPEAVFRLLVQVEEVVRTAAEAEVRVDGWLCEAVQAAAAPPASSSSRMGRNLSTHFRKAIGIFLILGFLVFIAEASDNSTVNYGANSNITAFSTCKKVTNGSATELSVYVPTQTSDEWASFYSNPPSGVTISSCATNITVPSGTNLDLYTLAGNPSTPGTYIFTIDSGTVINSSVTWLAALSTGSWPAGSSITLVNNGAIYGRGGDGGYRGYSPSPGGCPGGPGGAGGPALSMAYPLTIDNTNGYILGGGGGGGGAVGYYVKGNCSNSGAGGGGGQGSVNSAGGSPNGGAGTVSGPGAPGTQLGVWYAGSGGTWGAPGGYGSNTNYTVPPAPGGAGGAAVSGAGYGITWLGGYNGSQVRGAVQ